MNLCAYCPVTLTNTEQAMWKELRRVSLLNGSQPVPRPLKQRIATEQSKSVYQRFFWEALLKLAAIFPIAVLIGSFSTIAFPLWWVTLVCGAVSLRLAIWGVWRLRAPSASDQIWLNLFALGTLVEGLAWSTILLERTSTTDQTLLMLLTMLLAVGPTMAIPSRVAHFPSWFVGAQAIYVPLALTWLASPIAGILMSLFCVAYSLILTFTMLRLSRRFIFVTVRQLKHTSANKNMAAARDRAEAANKAKSMFLATMSHELRTPLNAVIGFSEIISKQRMGPVGQDCYREYAGAIHDSGQHLLALINDVLDLSCIEAGEFTLQKEQLNCLELVEACRQMMAPQADMKKITLSIRAQENLPTLYGDDRAVTQILVNLLTNAVKFTGEGGRVTISVSAAVTPQNQGCLSISVVDNGIGIAEQDIPKIFEPFRQIDSGFTRNHEGMGIGLAVTRSLVEMHDGSLEIESALGKGTTMTVILPATPNREASVFSEATEAI
jgi:signal transduction histidine kinase